MRRLPLEWFIFAGIVGIIAIIVLAAVAGSRYNRLHDCQETGRERLSIVINTGGIGIQVYEHEKRCDDGSTVWR